MSLRRVLVANRGEIAVRIIRACHDLGIEAVLAVSEADRDSLPARQADRVVCIGPPPASRSYLRHDAVLAAALGVGADALHPGYGFLAENAELARGCVEAGIRFVGPTAETIDAMGNKLAAREAAVANGVPLVPGSGGIADLADARVVAKDIGFPLLLKAASGGGGRGIRVVRREEELTGAFQAASAEAEAAFGDRTLYVERYVSSGRHIEVQVFGDGAGAAVHLGERDCSIQRRYQKVIEEAPALGIPEEVRTSLQRDAVALTRGISYANAGTVEFMYDDAAAAYYFLEMNTRIQVEHPVTEEIAGLDLVQLQLRLAGGESLNLEQEAITFDGHAIECRITAEDPNDGFRPSPGRLEVWEPPTGDGVRLDTHCYPGYVVPPFYDSLIAKLVIHAADRPSALARARAALDAFRVEGITTNIGFLQQVLADPEVQSGAVDTAWVERRMEAATARSRPTKD